MPSAINAAATKPELAFRSAIRSPSAQSPRNLSSLPSNEVVLDHDLALGAARPTRLAGGLRNKLRDRLASQGMTISSPRRTRSISVDGSAFASSSSIVTVMTLSRRDHVTQALRTVNPHQSSRTTRIVAGFSAREGLRSKMARICNMMTTRSATRQP
jgi:hypothetical protein